MIFWSGITVWNFLVVAVVSLVLCYKYSTRNFDYFAKKNVPFIKPVPFFGNAASTLIGKRPVVESLLQFCQIFKDYSLAGFFKFSNPLYIVKDPELIKLITVKDFDHFTDHIQTIPECAEPLFNANLEALKGEKWKRMKSILSPAFTISKMKGMVPLITDCAVQLLHHLDGRFESSGGSVLEVDMKDLFTRYTNDVTATTAFGICCDSFKNPENEFYLCGKDITEQTRMKYLIIMGFCLFPKLMTILGMRIFSKASSDFLYKAVHETFTVRRNEGIVRPDMIHLLMQAKKDLTCRDITAQVMIFLFAGFEMPSTVLSFTSVLLATHQDVQERLQEEIDQVLEDCDGKITCDALHNMKYLDMVVSESLRLYPPSVVTDRVCVKPYVIPATSNTPEVKLETGDKIFIPIVGIHRDPHYYPDPEKFDPERFSDENKHNINPYAYLPFGVGPRSCIGIRFALMEVKIALVYLLSKYTFEITERSPYPMKFESKGFEFAPEKGFWIGISPRKIESY